MSRGNKNNTIITLNNINYGWGMWTGPTIALKHRKIITVTLASPRQKTDFQFYLQFHAGMKCFKNLFTK